MNDLSHNVWRGRKGRAIAGIASGLLGTGLLALAAAPPASAGTPPNDPPFLVQTENRFAGADRYDTNVMIASSVFPGDGSTATSNVYFAVIVSGRDGHEVDALSASALAGDLADEDCSAGPFNEAGPIWTGFVSPLERDSRVGDYDSPDGLSDAPGVGFNPDEWLLNDGSPYTADAVNNWGGIPLYGNPWTCGAPLLLVGDTIPGVVSSYLLDVQPQVIIIVGGENAVSEDIRATLQGQFGQAQVLRIDGANRYETSANVARWIDSTNSYIKGVNVTFEVDDIGQFPRPSDLFEVPHCTVQDLDGVTDPIWWDDSFNCSLTTAFAATGMAPWDALAASALAFANSHPIFLVPSTGTLPDSTRLAMAATGLDAVVVLGLQNAVSDGVADQIAAIPSQLTNGILVDRVGGANREETAALLAKLADDETAFHFGAPLPNPYRIGLDTCDTSGTTWGYDTLFDPELLSGCPLTRFAADNGSFEYIMGTPFFGFSTDSVALARSDSPWDALTSSQWTGSYEYPLLLTPGGSSTVLSASVAAFLNQTSRSIIDIHIMGGSAALSATIAQQAAFAATTPAIITDGTNTHENADGNPDLLPDYMDPGDLYTLNFNQPIELNEDTDNVAPGTPADGAAGVAVRGTIDEALSQADGQAPTWAALSEDWMIRLVDSQGDTADINADNADAVIIDSPVLTLEEFNYSASSLQLTLTGMPALRRATGDGLLNSDHLEIIDSIGISGLYTFGWVNHPGENSYNWTDDPQDITAFGRGWAYNYDFGPGGDFGDGVDRHEFTDFTTSLDLVNSANVDFESGVTCTGWTELPLASLGVAYFSPVAAGDPTDCRQFSSHYGVFDAPYASDPLSIARPSFGVLAPEASIAFSIDSATDTYTLGSNPSTLLQPNPGEPYWILDDTGQVLAMGTYDGAGGTFALADDVDPFDPIQFVYIDTNPTTWNGLSGSCEFYGEPYTVDDPHSTDACNKPSDPRVEFADYARPEGFSTPPGVLATDGSVREGENDGINQDYGRGDDVVCGDRAGSTLTDEEDLCTDNSTTVYTADGLLAPTDLTITATWGTDDDLAPDGADSGVSQTCTMLAGTSVCSFDWAGVVDDIVDGDEVVTVTYTVTAVADSDYDAWLGMTVGGTVVVLDDTPDVVSATYTDPTDIDDRLITVTFNDLNHGASNNGINCPSTGLAGGEAEEAWEYGNDGSWNNGANYADLAVIFTGFDSDDVTDGAQTCGLDIRDPATGELDPDTLLAPDYFGPGDQGSLDYDSPADPDYRVRSTFSGQELDDRNDILVEDITDPNITSINILDPGAGTDVYEVAVVMSELMDCSSLEAADFAVILDVSDLGGNDDVVDGDDALVVPTSVTCVAPDANGNDNDIVIVFGFDDSLVAGLAGGDGWLSIVGVVIDANGNVAPAQTSSIDADMTV